MNTIWIVIPILLILMFLLGTDLDKKAFTNVARNPKAVVAGTIGQIILLPIIAFGIAWILKLPPIYFMGLVLVACCPGGSSSNVFSMLAKGDVALSITLTAISSLVTLITLPFIMNGVAEFVSQQNNTEVVLPVGKLLVQNIVLLFAPMLLGIVLRHFKPETAKKVNRILGKCAFPALMLLAGVFFLQYTKEIMENFSILGVAATALIVVAMLCSSILSKIGRFTAGVRRTIVIEVGMQNAAQAIAIASSPLIFNNGEMAIPAIIYALLMNIILLAYVAFIRKFR